MKRVINISIFLLPIFIVSFLLSYAYDFCFAANEVITLTTYYPAPYGVYNQMVTKTLGVGDNNNSGGMDGGDAPDPSTNPGDVWIAGNVGIGTTNPTAINQFSPLFANRQPKMEIETTCKPTSPSCIPTGAYQELVTLRHPNSDDNPANTPRRLGFLMKMSNEGDVGESNKMGGMILDSNEIWANGPDLHLVTANQKRVTVDNTGNVGIGTTNPIHKLEVKGRLTVHGERGAEFLPNGLNRHTRDKLVLWEMSRDGYNGGILPSQTVSASHAIGTEPFYNTYGPGDADPNFGEIPFNGTIGHKFYVRDNSPGPDGLAAQIGVGGSPLPPNRFNSYFFGNVGIGTTNIIPYTRLQIFSAAFGSAVVRVISASGARSIIELSQSIDNQGVINIMDGSGNRTIHLNGGDQASSYFTAGNLGIGTTNPQAKVHIVRGTATTSFRVDDAANDPSPFLIGSAGNVGIGTISPQAKLDVVGNVAVSGDLKVSSNTWGDTPMTVTCATPGHGAGQWDCNCPNGYFVGGIRTTRYDDHDRDWVSRLYCKKL